MNNGIVKYDASNFWAVVNEIEALAFRLDGLSGRFAHLFEELPTRIFQADVRSAGVAPVGQEILVSLSPAKDLENVLAALRTLDVILHPKHDTPPPTA